MADRYDVAMLMLHSGTPRDQEARRQLADALPSGSEVAEPDELGVFEVRVDADDPSVLVVDHHALAILDTTSTSTATPGTDAGWRSPRRLGHRDP